jgi:hypothetical protein
MLAALLALSLSSAPIVPADYVGSWDVKTTVTYSTCGGVKLGDAFAHAAEFSIQRPKVKIDFVRSGSSGGQTFTGGFAKDGTIWAFYGDGDGLQLSGDSHRLTGRRVRALHEGIGGADCAIVMDAIFVHRE